MIKQTNKKCHSCIHLDLVLFFCQDPDADEVKEETGTVGNCLWKGGGTFLQCWAQMQTLCLVSNRKRDWKPKGNCWLFVDILLTIINNLTGKYLSCQLCCCNTWTAVVNNLIHTDSNEFQGQGGVSCAGDCIVSRGPHEDQDKEDASRPENC